MLRWKIHRLQQILLQSGVVLVPLFRSLRKMSVHVGKKTSNPTSHRSASLPRHNTVQPVLHFLQSDAAIALGSCDMVSSIFTQHCIPDSLNIRATLCFSLLLCNKAMAASLWTHQSSSRIALRRCFWDTLQHPEPRYFSHSFTSTCLKRKRLEALAHSLFRAITSNSIRRKRIHRRCVGAQPRRL